MPPKRSKKAAMVDNQEISSLISTIVNYEKESEYGGNNGQESHLLESDPISPPANGSTAHILASKDHQDMVEPENCLTTSGEDGPNQGISSRIGGSLSQQINLSYQTAVFLQIQRKDRSIRKHDCPICGKAFSFKCLLTRHMKTHSPDRSHQCLHCLRLFPDESRLLKHMKSHTNQPGSSYSSSQSQSQSFYLPPKSEMKDGSYECPWCNKAFNSKGNFERHIRIHTDQKPFPCTICGNAYRRSTCLLSHIKLAHPQEYSKRTCPECGKVFTNLERLSRHRMNHSSYRPYVCSLCGKSFMRNHNLEAHMRSHTGEKRREFEFECSICGVGFTQRDDLDAHAVTHSGIKSHQCSVCDKGFYQATSLRIHMKICHGITPHEDGDVEKGSQLGLDMTKGGEDGGNTKPITGTELLSR